MPLCDSASISVADTVLFGLPCDFHEHDGIGWLEDTPLSGMMASPIVQLISTEPRRIHEF